ncbi:MAG: 4Fe-4S binding protein [Halobacteriota archaeon]|nr:4Fe-4S binding protein [Halobacteriota archaeon]
MDRQILRRISQITVLLIILVGVGTNIAFVRNLSLGYFSWFCPFFYTQTVFIWGSAGMGPWLPLLVIVLGGVILLTLLFGRVFCSWICPFGTVLDGVGVLKDKKKKSKFPEFLADRTIKYGILFGFIIGAFVLQRPAFCDICPAGAFYRVAGPATSGGFTAWLFVPVALMLGMLGIAVFYDTRAPCKYFCPLGALFSIFDRFSLGKSRVVLPVKKCIECLKCEKECPMGIRTVEEAIWKEGSGTVEPGECIRCYACVDNCPMKDRQPMKLEDELFDDMPSRKLDI